MAESAWQGIETAPKDRPILIVELGKYITIATWGVFYSPFYRGDVGGWWTSSDANCHVVRAEDATHWQPLPTPP